MADRSGAPSPAAASRVPLSADPPTLAHTPPDPAQTPGDLRRARRAQHRDSLRRRRLIAAVLVTALLVLVGVAALRAATGAHGRSAHAGPGGSPVAPAPPGVVSLEVPGRPAVTLPTAAYERAGQVNRGALAALVYRLVPARRVVSTGQAHISYRYARGHAVSAIAGLGARGGTVRISRTAFAATIDAPVIGQVERNDCETTALQILLSTAGRHVDQRILQAQVAHSGPLDPQGSGASEVWGDPSQGFVGRPEGGGVAGGFGVYQGPIRALARRHGVTLSDLSGSSTSRLYNRVLEGHAVMVWIALADGPYQTWRSPSGRPVTVNFGEHSVVVTGVGADGQVTVDDPLSASRLTWTRADFEARWRLLGRRALSA